MSNYYTPVEVAKALVRYAPKNIATLLEPSVGTGILIKSLMPNICRSIKDLVCIDIDETALNQVKANLSQIDGKHIKTVKEDFLTWVKKKSNTKKNYFDCILMNPPFGGKKSQSIKIKIISDDQKSKNELRSVPIEGAFIYESIKLLKPGGRLLAILPPSVITSKKASWLRSYLFQQGSILYVHELQNFTFKGVESKIYLFVFEKATQQKEILLCNHDLIQSEKMKMKISHLTSDMRLDYGFYNSLIEYDHTREHNKNLGWSELKNFASVLRGSIASPDQSKSAIHSTDYKNGFWAFKGNHQSSIESLQNSVKASDLLIKRVSRKCSTSIGIVKNSVGVPCTDCLLIIRPKKADLSIRLLFALRTLLSFDYAPALIERGTGATYITETDLRRLLIPVNLSETFPVTFKNYCEAVNNWNFNRMVEIEVETCKLIKKATKTNYSKNTQN